MKKLDPRSEIRRKNARDLAASVGGQAEFGRKTGMSDSQVTQLLGDKPTKNIGNIIAPRIEEAFKKPSGWLDAAHSAPAEPLLSTVQVPSRKEIPTFYIDQQEIDIINAYRRGSASGKLSIRAAAAAVAAATTLDLGLDLDLNADHES